MLEKGESCCRGAEKERVHFQGLFVLFFENVLGAGKSLNRQRGDQVDRADGKEREGLILASKSAAQPSALS